VESLFASGRAIDIVLAVMLVEGLWLWRRGRAGPLDIALALLPGALILLGARGALTGAPWPAIALPVLLSWPVHLADLRRRRW
jgi:hypothetical protein